MRLSCASTLAKTHIPLARTHQTYLPVLSSGKVNEFGESASLCLKIIMAKSNIYNSLILLRYQAKHFIYIMFKLIHSFKVTIQWFSVYSELYKHCYNKFESVFIISQIILIHISNLPFSPSP